MLSHYHHSSAPYQFDVFSAALIICQLLFNYLDERTDAGFHQQLEDADWDLDLWLSRELGSKVRPAGLEEALEYLSARPGLWRLLGDMLRRDPEQRVSSQEALRRWQFLQSSEVTDGPFFESVVALMDQCEVAPPTVQRPLHFVATFRRNMPLGLVLSEADTEMNTPEWIEATADAERGEVFVQSILSDSQADQMGIFEVGDRLQGVGELPLMNMGFNRVVEMVCCMICVSKKCTLST
jgi:serine/threonine protein kinase